MKGKTYKKKHKSLTTKQRKEVRKIVRVDRRLNNETKYFDKAASSSMTDQWTWVQLVLPTPGDADAGDRNGDKIMPLHMEIRGAISYGDTYDTVRMVIFRVKSGTSSNSYFHYGSSAPNSYSVYSPYTHDKRANIEVLYDRTLAVNSSGGNAVTIVKDLRLAKKKIQFFAGTSTYETGGLYLAFCSDSTIAPHPGFIYNIRTFYDDA